MEKNCFFFFVVARKAHFSEVDATCWPQGGGGGRSLVKRVQTVEFNPLLPCVLPRETCNCCLECRFRFFFTSLRCAISIAVGDGKFFVERSSFLGSIII